MPVRLSREDESRTVRFSVSADGAAAGEYQVGAAVENGSERFTSGFQVIEYPHIERRHIGRRAAGTFKIIDVAVASDLVVGYVEGVGDAVPPAIEQLGAHLEFIDADGLAWGDLSRFDVIVTGVRAYERRQDLRANNDRLLEYVDDGGTVIVQYNKFEFNEAQYGPYPALVSRNRVTDEAAPIRVLANDHPVFAWPNPVGPATWEQWVQERGLYFLGERDERYADLVELEDTFEYNPGLKRGALVEAQPGRGRWIYVGLGLWRQLPAGTTGGVRVARQPAQPGSRRAVVGRGRTSKAQVGAQGRASRQTSSDAGMSMALRSRRLPVSVSSASASSLRTPGRTAVPGIADPAGPGTWTPAGRSG